MLDQASNVAEIPSAPPQVSASQARAAESWRLARAAQEDLRQLGMPRVNVLFVGADDIVWRLLATSLNLASPIVSWRPGEPMHLPESAAVRTLVIREVGIMSGAEQVRLLEYLDRVVGRTQVVCTSSVPLMPLVEDGRFINALYYRLNTVCVDVNSPA